MVTRTIAMTVTPLPLLAVAAYSGTGKTTLLQQLIPLLDQAGLRVGIINAYTP